MARKFPQTSEKTFPHPMENRIPQPVTESKIDLKTIKFFLYKPSPSGTKGRMPLCQEQTGGQISA
jgi:hypothetical protein